MILYTLFCHKNCLGRSDSKCKVAVDHVVGVEVLQSREDLAEVQLRRGCGEGTVLVDHVGAAPARIAGQGPESSLILNPETDFQKYAVTKEVPETQFSGFPRSCTPGTL